MRSFATCTQPCANSDRSRCWRSARSEEGRTKGSIELLHDRILIGYVGTLYNGEGNLIDFESWRSILAQAHRHKVDTDRRSLPLN